MVGSVAVDGDKTRDGDQPLRERADAPARIDTQFANDFTLAHLTVFDDATLRLVASGAYGAAPRDLAAALPLMPAELAARLHPLLPADRPWQRLPLRRRQRRAEANPAARRTLDALFWELTYWQTPERYEELTEGERLHPAIFRRLARDLRGATVLDAGAGSGRATFEALQHGAARVYAAEPSAGLLRLLRAKAVVTSERVAPLRARFDALPLPAGVVDVAMVCSAFSTDDHQGGEVGLAELRRVTRPGGLIVIIWPGEAERWWLAERGFRYEAVSDGGDMTVRFRSMAAALRAAGRFYARNRAVMRHLLRSRQPELPYDVLGVPPPRDYCWLRLPA